jgi:hypothetical protein
VPPPTLKARNPTPHAAPAAAPAHAAAPKKPACPHNPATDWKEQIRANRALIVDPVLRPSVTSGVVVGKHFSHEIIRAVCPSTHANVTVG